MATITGTDLAKGTRARIDGRWVTLTTDPETMTIGGRPYPRMRQAKTRGDHGDEDWVNWLTDDVFALPGTTAAIITCTDYDQATDAGGHPTIVFEIAYTRREWRDGWTVTLAGTGRRLGWLVPARDDHGDRVKGWDARALPDAFRGDGPDDQGDPLDQVPDDLYGARSDGSIRAIAWGIDRDAAVRELVRILYGKRAPALGFGAHYRVRPYHGYFCRGGGRRWATAASSPVCPVCHAGPGGIGTRRPRRHRQAWAGTVPFHAAREA